MKDTDGFSATDLLIIGRLAVKAYDAIAELRVADLAKLADTAESARVVSPSGGATSSLFFQ
ncbi:MAG: hypothetical protein AAFY46_03510 [Planctomycetota bacterium]